MRQTIGLRKYTIVVEHPIPLLRHCRELCYPFLSIYIYQSLFIFYNAYLIDEKFFVFIRHAEYVNCLKIGVCKN